MFVKQISVYLENVKGSLRELTQLLGDNNINLLALCVADTTGFGIIRCIVKSSDVERTTELLRTNGYISKTNHVVCVSIPHRPSGLAYVLALLEANDIFIEYTYSFCRSNFDSAVILIRPSDKDKCAKVLTDNNVTLVSQQQVDMIEL